MYFALLCCAPLCCACSVVLCCVPLCCAPLCCATLLCCARCCVVLCCVVLCSIVLYSVVLCSIVLSRKKFISHLYMNIEGHFCGLPVASPMTSSPWKHLFLHNLGWSFSWCWIEAVFNILTFSKWPPFWGRGEFFFTESDTGIWICYKDSPEHLWHFELLIDALAQILTEILQFKVLTYFGTIWRHQWSNQRSLVKAYS